MEVEKRKHLWNGRWGRLARHDVLLYEDGGRWAVEERIGGSNGRIAWAEFDREQAALDRIRDLLDGPGEWREIG